MTFRSCGIGQSLFQLITDYWGNLRKRAPAFHRICTLMRLMGVETAVIEQLRPSAKEYARFQLEADAIKVRIGNRKITANKFTFLRRSVTNKLELKSAHADAKRGADDIFLGYIIIVNVAIGNGTWGYIFESVIREIGSWDEGQKQWKQLQNHYLSIQRLFECQVGTLDYDMRGSYFRQQNSITNVCAHACASMMLSNLSGQNEIVSAEQLNHFLNIDQRSKKFRLIPKVLAGLELAGRRDLKGVKTPKLKQFFASHGYEAYDIKFGTPIEQRGFRSFLYGFVESQFPAFLSFKTLPNPTNFQTGADLPPSHVVAVVGHTLSPHSWLPLSRPYAESWAFEHLLSLAWVDHLIIHDDNFGAQLTIPAHAFKPQQNPDQSENFSPDDALGILPTAFNVRMLSDEATSVAASAIRNLVRTSKGEALMGNRYTERFLEFDEKFPELLVVRKDLIYRPLLVPWKDYFDRYWREYEMSSQMAQYLERIENSGLERLWLVEITEPDLYVGNQSKLIDVLINPAITTQSAEYNNGLLMIRRPQGFLVPRPYSTGWDELPGYQVPSYLPLFSYKKSRA